MAGSLNMSEVIEIALRGNDEYNADCYTGAKPLYEKALEQGEDRMEWEMRSDVRNALAKCYHHLAEYQKAADLNEGTLQLSEWTPTCGLSIEDKADIRYELARNLSAVFESNPRDKTKLERAVALYKQNLQVLKGSSHTGIITDTEQSLGRALARLGRYPEAEKLYKKLLRERPNSQNSNPNNVETIEIRHNYASVLYHLGRFEESKKSFLYNQTKIEALSDAQKIRLAALSQSTAQYLEACSEATGDLGLAISRSPSRMMGPPVDSSEETQGSVDNTTADRIPAIQSNKRSQAGYTDGPRNIEDLFAPSIKHRSTASSPGRDAKLSLAQPANLSIRKAKSEESLEKSKEVDPSRRMAITSSEVNAKPHFPTYNAHHGKDVDDPGKQKIVDLVRAELRRSRDDGVSSSQRASGDIDRGSFFEASSASSTADSWFNIVRASAHNLLYEEKAKIRDRKPVSVAIIDSGSDFAPGVEAHGWLERLKRESLEDYKDFATVNAKATGASRQRKSHGAYCAAFLLQVAPNAKFYIANIRSGEKDGVNAKAVANALAWAIDLEVDIVTMSFGWDFLRPEVDAQLDRARLKNILTFAAASNKGGFAEEHGAYPACHPTVFCIYSCSGSGVRSDFNPQGSREKINFMFPGEKLTILRPSGKAVDDQDRLSGTSYATPLAVGTAALVLELVRCQRSDYRQVEWPLKRYEGMAAVFQRMTTGPENGFYQVKPWLILRKARMDALIEPRVSSQWSALRYVMDCLERFQTPTPEDLMKSRELYDESLK